MLNLNALGMAISLINHSHSFHPDNNRRKLFSMIDQKYMIFFGLLVSYKCIRKNPNFYCFLRVGGNMLLISYIYLYLLEGYKQKPRSIESYNEKQKFLHMLLHFVSIIGLTNAYKRYYLDN
jgi:hypothetical protein